MVSRVKDLFEAEAGSFGDTMMAHNGVAGYKVPEYQRQYNWKQEHLGRLLADCLNGFYRLSTSSDPAPQPPLTQSTRSWAALFLRRTIGVNRRSMVPL